MTSALVEHNLLCGLVALRHGMVVEPARREALADWVTRPAMALDQILRERQILSIPERQRLLLLVEDSLTPEPRMFQPPESQLPPVMLGPSIDQATIQARAEPVTAQGDSDPAAVSGDPADFLLWDPVAAAPDPLRDHPRFRILRPHARGGIGEISVALDTELNREVALKAIQVRHAADPASRARFLLEAEVTGRLEHPGVVPVYGLGNDPTGRPFYAMRFVRGESLKDAIETFHVDDVLGHRREGDRRVALRRLLGRFVDVCQVVAYAHSRGVIHRDIKPANVLLGPYGETLLVDWGLAKVVGRREPGRSAEHVAVPPAPAEAHPEETLRPAGCSHPSETMAGFAIGTPQYMSPEQARGAVDEIGPASDIYSLGASLYALLAGRPPHDEGDVADMLKQVEAGQFETPRSVNNRVPRALEAVVLKAMARDPADRYTSARDLASEIERWMADEPVSAFQEPAPTQWLRWLTRHRVAVTAAGAAGIMALLGLIVLSLFQTQANHDLSRSFDLLARANGAMARANIRATERFDLAQDAIDKFQSSLSQNAQLQQPELIELRQTLVGEAIQFYRRLESVMKSDPDPIAQERLAKAYESLAGLSASVGERGEAKRMLRQAVEIQDRLAATQGSPTDLTIRVVRDLTTLARLEAEDGQTVPAEEALADAAQRLEDALQASPHDPDLTRELTEVSGQLASLTREPVETR